MLSPVKIWRNQKNIRDLLGQTGRIISWTVIRVPPSGFADQAPYVVAVIGLEGNRRITCQVVDADVSEIISGMAVVLKVRRIKQPDEDGVIQYGIKAVSL